MKIVGLKIDKGVLAATVVAKGLRRRDVLDSFSMNFGTDAELVEILKGKAAAWAGALVVSSIPGSYFSQRTVRLPFDDRKKLEKALPFEIEDVVPFQLDDIVMDHMILQHAENGGAGRGAVVLAVMLPKDVLRRHMELLSAAGIDPQVIVPSYAGLFPIAMMLKPDVCAAIVCGRDMCVKKGERVVALRTFSASPSGGLLHTLKCVEAREGVRIEKILVLCSGDPYESGELEIPVEQRFLELGSRRPADALSLGLALLNDMNLRRGQFAYRRADEAGRRRMRTIIIAGAAAGMLAAANMGIRFYIVESRYKKIEAEIKELYRKTFPESRAAGDYLKLMRSSLDDATKKFGMLGAGTSAIEILKAVTDGVPKEARVAFQEFALEGDKVKLQGEAGSFEAVDRIKAEMSKISRFENVTVQDTRMGVENKVKFRMEIKLKAEIQLP